jgi:hypothetical protein
MRARPYRSSPGTAKRSPAASTAGSADETGLPDHRGIVDLLDRITNAAPPQDESTI